ncbi:MAG: YqgE/AlgH family protein [Halioglobus sp.]
MLDTTSLANRCWRAARCKWITGSSCTAIAIRPGGQPESYPEITLTTSRDILRSIANGDGPRDHLIALGYAGWAAGQLEQELAENSWLTLPGNSEIIFATPVEQRLGAAAALLGIDMNLISGQAGHA